MKNTYINSRTLQLLRESCLQIMFPRVCPVCGQILKQPPKWNRILLPGQDLRQLRSFSPADSFSPIRRYSPSPGVAPIPDEAINYCRSGMICPDCFRTLNYVKEPVCRKCSKPLFEEDEQLCEMCRKSQRFFDAGSALLMHDEPTKKILYDLKFHNHRDNAELIGFETALRKIEEFRLWKPQAIIPVPLHKKRFRERGFNQAQLLSEKISFWLEKLYGYRLPVDPDYLLRTEYTKPMRKLQASMRAGNICGAFTVVPKKSEDGRKSIYRSVVIIDDIYTSGATLSECARTLKAAGTKEVYFLTASVV